MTQGVEASTYKKGICGTSYILERPRKSTSLNLLNSLLNSWEVRSAGIMLLNYLEAVNIFHKSNTKINVANVRRLFTSLHEVNKFGKNIFLV